MLQFFFTFILHCFLFQLFREPPQGRHLGHGRRYRGNSNLLRRFQTQLVSGSSETYKYIPLHTRPPIRSSKLWWQPLSIDIPSSYATVTIFNSAESTNSEEKDFQLEEEASTTHQQEIILDEKEYQTTLTSAENANYYDDLEYESSTIPYDEEYFNEEEDTTTSTDIIPTMTTNIYDLVDEG